LCRLFPPIVPVSHSGAFAIKQHSFRTAPDADKIWVCALASRIFSKKRAAKHEALHRATIPLIEDDLKQPCLENRRRSLRQQNVTKMYLDSLNQSVKTAHEAATGD
jgi:hypothetical protein